MKKLILVLIVAALPAAAADLSGSWKLEGNIADVHINRVCTLQQTGAKLSGKCKNPTNEVVLAGSVDGQNVTWRYDADYQGIKVTLAFSGKLESGSSIKGKIDSEGTAGNFTATRQ